MLSQGDNYDITILQGATWREVFTYTDADDVAIDISAYSARGQVRERKDRESLLLAEITLDLSDGVNGNLTASISAADTDAMDRSGFYDIELVNGLEVIRLIQGRAHLDKSVTE